MVRFSHEASCSISSGRLLGYNPSFRVRWQREQARDICDDRKASGHLAASPRHHLRLRGIPSASGTGLRWKNRADCEALHVRLGPVSMQYTAVAFSANSQPIREVWNQNALRFQRCDVRGHRTTIARAAAPARRSHSGDKGTSWPSLGICLGIRRNHSRFARLRFSVPDKATWCGKCQISALSYGKQIPMVDAYRARDKEISLSDRDASQIFEKRARIPRLQMAFVHSTAKRIKGPK
jgi:hypothetical protein